MDEKDGQPARLERLERSKRSEKGSLLPIVPDEISINLIVPRLPWRTLMLLAQVNRAWQGALKSPDVYDVRDRASSSQIIITIHHYECIVFLYDTAAESWHFLPRSPFGRMLVARGCSCVSLRGKLYILGGNREDFQPRDNVHVFDLTGQGQWKQCTSMKTARKHFACGVKDGKIYVFGGIGAGSAAEVYDPMQDSWHDIAPMLFPRIEHKVVNIGEVFCVHMGRFYDSDSNRKLKWGYAHFAEIYDPRKDHWTLVANFTMNSSPTSMGAEVAEAAVVIEGKLHRILDDRLYVYDEPLNSGQRQETLRWDGSGSWRTVQSISWDVFRFPGSQNYFNPFARAALAIANDGELLALVFGQASAMSNRKWIFLKSEGLGRKDQKLLWKRVQCSGSLPQVTLRSSWAEDGNDFPFAPCMYSIPGVW